MKLIKTDLRGLNAFQMLSRARVVRNQMKNNPLFPSPTPTMAVFELAIDDLRASVASTYGGGSKLAFHEKHRKLETVASMIKSLAAYVSIIAQGETSIVLAAGFEQRRSSAPINTLTQPQRQNAKSGSMPQTIDVRWAPVRGARMYKVHITMGYCNVEGPVRIVLSSKSHCRIEGLEPLEYYTMRIQALGTHDEGPLSAMTSALSVGFKAA
ncbi:MAG: fibronectin type III domain-containing protein [Flavobacteriales bacterium]